MNMSIKYILILISLLSSAFINAQTKFTVSAPNVVAVGENFRLTYTLNAQGSNLRVPAFKDFSIISGPNASTSSNMSIVNGQVSQSVTYTYTYFLQATKEGKYKIDAATISAGGKDYQSNTLSIEVVKNQSGQSQVNSQNNNNQQTQSSTIDDVNGDDLFVRVSVDKSTLYQGEHLVATLKVYTKLDLAGFDNFKFPSFNGFWSQDIETPSQISLQRENVNGVIYNMGVIKKELLYPQQSGEITIEPFELTCVVRQKVNNRQRSIFDDFFGNYQNVKKKVVSPKVKINVKPLPDGKPTSFNGAVGKFTFQATIDKNNVKTNDAITLKIKISGNGNLKLADVPKVNFPPDFETYDPKVSDNITSTGAGTSGTKTYEYLLIPRHAGNFRIAPVEFSYFDVDSKQYKEISSEEFNITVEKGADDNSGTVMSNFSKEDVKYIGSDIRFIKTKNIELKPKGSYVLGSLWHNLAFPLSLAIFIFIVVIRRKQIKENADAMLVKNRKANKMAKKRLNTASKYLKENKREQFYDETLKAMWGYLSDKLSIPIADLNREKAFDCLVCYKLENELISDLNNLLDTCEFARFAPTSESGEMNKIYNSAINIIGVLDNKIKRNAKV